MNDKDRIWHLAGKKLAGEASADELTELEGLLRSDPDMHYSLQNINDIWQLPARDGQEVDGVFNRHLSRMKAAGITDWKEEEEQQTQPLQVDNPFRQLPSRSYHTIAWVSVIACFVLATVFFLYYPSNSTKLAEVSAGGNHAATKNEISTRNGSKTKISLPDGSIVWLNSGSNLVYPKEFGNSTREVELTGEAFFDVVKNPDHPFVIHTRHLDIRVIGTAFNVKSYPGDQRTITSLVRGKVEVFIHNRPNEKFVLKPNEKLVVLNEETAEPANEETTTGNQPIVSVSKLTHSTVDNIVVETAWVQNKLVFDNESFTEVAAKMKRWYNVEFEFAAAGTQGLRFTGVFENETIQQALDAMMITAEFNYRLQGNRVIIQK
jgi:transmembrane sensor